MQSLKILVVEDFERVRRSVCSALEQRGGFEITQASDGLEAVQKAEKLQPDLILLDVGLPNLNGIEVAKRVRRLAPAAKILFLSVESDPDVIRKAFSVGALGYIHKTRIQRDLLPAIDALLGGKPFVSRDLNFNEGTDAQPPYHHKILFSSDDEGLQDSLATFIAAALNVGDAAIVWVTEPHRDDLLRRLRARGVNPDAAVQGGTYIAADAAETADPVHLLAVIRGLIQAASRAGKERPRVAVCGERAGRLWAEGKTDEAIRLEQLLNHIAASCADIDILCVYRSPHGQDHNHTLSCLCAEHSAVSFR